MKRSELETEYFKKETKKKSANSIKNNGRKIIIV